METAILPGFGETIRRVMALDSTIFLAYKSSPNGLLFALLLVTVAGGSKALGQSVILFINHVRPLRFALALCMGAVQHVVGFLLWTTAVWLAGVYGFQADATWAATATAVGVAYAPQILSFFELTPFLGNAFGFLLSFWSLLAMIAGVQVGLGLSPVQAILASGLGWLLLQIWARTLGRPLHALGWWIEHKLVATPIEYTWQDVPQLRRAPSWARATATPPTTIDPVTSVESPHPAAGNAAHLAHAQPKQAGPETGEKELDV